MLESLIQIIYKRLENSNDELSQFAYRTSHDLKAPLLSIDALLEFVIEDIKEGDIEEAISNIDKIKSSSMQLQRLTEDILDLTKLDNINESEVKVSLKAVEKSIFQKLEPYANELKVELRKSSDQDITLTTEPVRFEQLVENLVSNAIKYCDQSKENPFVQINFKKQTTGAVQVSVQDNGLGIPEAYHQKMFTMFQRFHTKVAFGSGLGLHLVKKNIEKIGGTIEFISKENEGSTFTITLKE